MHEDLFSNGKQKCSIDCVANVENKIFFLFFESNVIVRRRKYMLILHGCLVKVDSCAGYNIDVTSREKNKIVIKILSNLLQL